MLVANDESLKRDKLERFCSSIIQKEVKGLCPVSVLYNTHFNYLDLHDRYFYKVEYKHKILNWHSKFALDLINVFIVNCWTLYTQKELIDFLPFRRALAEALLGIESTK